MQKWLFTHGERLGTRNPIPFILLSHTGPGLAIRVICQMDAYLREDFSTTNTLLAHIVDYHHCSQTPSPMVTLIEQFASPDEKEVLLRVTKECILSATLLPIFSVGVQVSMVSLVIRSALSSLSSLSNLSSSSLCVLSHLPSMLLLSLSSGISSCSSFSSLPSSSLPSPLSSNLFPFLHIPCLFFSPHPFLSLCSRLPLSSALSSFLG